MALQLVKTRFSWYFPIFIIIILVIGIVSSWYVYHSVDSSSRESLIYRAETIALALDPEEISILKGDATDLQSEAYLNLKKKITQIREANKDSRFVYIMGKRGEELFFFADSENPLSEDYSPPGQVYYEESIAFDEAFTYKLSGSEGPTSDRWGTWITAVAPIQGADGAVIAIVGIDVDAGEFKERLITYTAVPLLITLALIIFVSIGMAMRRQEERFLELKSRFVAIASHEIRSPLTGLNWAMQSFRNDPNLPTASQKRAGQMSDTMQQLLDTTNDLLDALSLDSAKNILLAGRVDIADIVSQAVANTKLFAEEKGINVVSNSIPAGITIVGDVGKLRQALMNVISNAIKYSHAGDTVTISYASEQGKHAISIEDHGIGIPEKEQKKVFEGLYRASNALSGSINGTGLGLYLVKRIVELHHGKVELVSVENKGTTVIIHL